MMNQIITTLIQRAQHTPDDTAFSGSRHGLQQQSRLSYSQLLTRVQQAAELLQAWSVNCIALRADNSLDWVIIDLAAMYARIPIVPVPMFFSQAQVEHTLQQSGADLLVGEWLESHGIADDRIEGFDVWRLSSGLPQWLPDSSKITFTSGSTGQPKGVCLGQKQLIEVSCALAAAIQADVCCKTHLIMLPLSTLLENITGVYVPILLGANSVVLSGF
ncbi:AMP-binding protein [Vibrio sp. CDRSL-10 TSBA]